MLHPAINILLSPGYCPEAKDYFSRLPNSLDASRKKLIDTFIRALVNGGVWSKLDVLYLLANTDAANAVVNLLPPVGANTYNAVTVNSPTFTQDRGILVHSTGTKYVKTGFNPSTANGKFQLNSASLFAYSRTNIANTQYTGARSVADGKTSSIAIKIAGSLYASLNGNQNTFGGGANADSLGLYLATRLSNISAKLYKNSTRLFTQDSSGAANSVGLTEYEMYIGAANIADNGTPSLPAGMEYAIWGCGGGLSDGVETLVLSQAISEYLTSIGANV